MRPPSRSAWTTAFRSRFSTCVFVATSSGSSAARTSARSFRRRHERMRQELKDVEQHMNGAIAHLKDRFKTLRTGRANLGILDGILVSAYGAEVPINQVANLSVPEPTLIVAAPWDPKMAQEIERAIRKSDLGLNPQSDGKIVRVPIPSLTEERRKDLAKKAHHMAEEARVEIRRFRHEGNDRLKKMFKEKQISEDDERRGLEESQQLTDKKITEVVDFLEGKEKEILAV